MNLKNKTVLVTGSSSGIGQAIAIEFAKKGATVLVHYHANKKGGEKTLDQVKKYSKGFLYQADLTGVSNVQQLFKEIQKNVSGIDILVNNAGDAEYGDFFDNNVWVGQHENIFMTVLYTMQNFMKIPNKNQRKIINISSIYGNLFTSNPAAIAYSVAKAGINSLTVNTAKLFGDNVLVNAIAPGYTLTPAWDDVPLKNKKYRTDNTFIKRFLDPKEIASTAIFLAEHDAITGQIITVDGGTTMLHDAYSNRE